MIAQVTSSIFSGSVIPVNLNYNFGSGYTLGFRFTSTINVFILGFLFYKSSGDTGGHTGSLWDDSGNLLVTQSFTGETAAGWQTAMLLKPYQITSSVVYRTSYLMTSGIGEYSGILGSTYTTDKLSIFANGGLYTAGSTNSYPNSSGGNWYGNDVIFAYSYIVPGTFNANTSNPLQITTTTFQSPPNELAKQFIASVKDRIGVQGVIGALQGVSVGGPTSINGDGTFGRHMQVGVNESFVEGNPSTPSLQLAIPGFWRFRWSIIPGVRTIYINVKQPHFLTDSSTPFSPPVTIFYPPTMIVKANPSVGLLTDLAGTASISQDWIQIGPLSFTAAGYGPVWVELHNNNTNEYNTPAYFDHIITT